MGLDLIAERLSDAVAEQIVSEGVFTVVERQRIVDVMHEQALGALGVTDEKSASIGKLLGAKAIILGFLSKDNEGFVVATRVISVETGMILGANSKRGNSQYGLEELAKVSAAAASVPAVRILSP